MPQITIRYKTNTNTDIKVKTVVAPEGSLLSDLLVLHAAGFELPCAGRGTCRRCRVRTEGGIMAPSAQEKDALSAIDLAGGFRLACLARVSGDACIEVPESSADCAIAVSGFLPDFELNPDYEGFAAAVDLGTTTIAAALCASDSRSVLQTAAVKNPQGAYGADVISRIENALAGKTEELSLLIRGAINTLFDELLPPRDFSRITITGNTAMLYLLVKQNPKRLAVSPFVLERPFGETLYAGDLGFNVLPETPVYIPRCLSPFVGADISAGIAAVRLCEQKKTTLLVDIGTNAESALFVPEGEGKLFVCSSPAGPAFEGATLSCGMRSGRGAVESVTFAAHSLVCAVTGGEKAEGLCGSGIVDALAVFLQTGIIDKTGAIQTEGHDFEHLVCKKDGQNAVFLSENVCLTQQDIRSVQTAKSAVCSASQILLKEAGISENDVETVYISGGFGSRLNMQNAAVIGLLPRILCARAVITGNASLSGAFLINQNALFSAEIIARARNTTPVDLCSNEYFASLFINNMNF